MVKQGVILASGLGSRLNSEGRNEPKPLMSVGGMALIERVIVLMQSVGINHIVVVLGYRSEQMEEFFEKKRVVGIETVVNDEYNKKNGISLLKAQGKLSDEPFLLSMADHVFSNDFFKIFVEKAEPALEDMDALLSVDKNIEGVFDLNDATKVAIKDGTITKIAKNLSDYDSVDTGLFLCNHKIFEKLEHMYSQTGDVSISEGMMALADDGKFGAIDMTGFLWQDVDTPSMKIEAEERLIDAFIASQPCKDFFLNKFFLKASKEIAVGLLKKEHFDWKVAETLFFVIAILISVFSVKLEIVFPSILTVLGATFLFHLNRLRSSIKPTDKESNNFFLFSYGVNMVISMMPAVLDTNIIAALIILGIMVVAVSSKPMGFQQAIKAQLPEISEEITMKFICPSFFAFIYTLLVILPLPSIFAAITGALFLLFYESQHEPEE
ncbi:MAG: NTP transferase domain-containing protein [bacterium]